MKEVFHLAAPLIFTIIIIQWKNLKFSNEKIGIHKIFYHLNPRLGLSDQLPLWFWILLPTSYFFSTGIACWSGYRLDFSASGFETFLDISKLPLGILSLTIPITVLISRLHSTQQTATQIIEAEKKNKMDSFYNQRKFYVEYINSTGFIQTSQSTKIEIKVTQSLFTVLFPEASSTNGASKPNAQRILAILEDIYEGLTKLRKLGYPKSHPDVDFGYEFLLMNRIANQVCSQLCIKDHITSYFQSLHTVKFVYWDNDEKVRQFESTCPGLNFDHYLSIFRCAQIILGKTLQDHQTYNTSDPEQPDRQVDLIRKITDETELLGFHRTIEFFDEISSMLSRRLISLPKTADLSFLEQEAIIQQ